ncbi:hypothetical protein C8F01DRAFT_1064577 [Mycena amicta]|nr:hypothetical protein C8F01DRAFT_1064577 [Mycena amicta]
MDCLQPSVVCRQCFLRQHRRSPTHWAGVWNTEEHFFEKTDISRVADNSAVYLGHNGEYCPHARAIQNFTLVDTNGIHATLICFCGCPGAGDLAWKQLLRAGIFPATVLSPHTGFTLRLLEQWREYRHQGHLSLYDFMHILQRLADPWTPMDVPDASKFFDNINRVFEYLEIRLVRGQKHGAEAVLPEETERAYPHRPTGYLGIVCAACPEPGVNMPLGPAIPSYLRHLASEHITFDGNFKANLFYKRDNGTDKAVTDGLMYFPRQDEAAEVAKKFVVNAEDLVRSSAHIGSIRNQGKFRYKNTRVSGVVTSACDHGLPASFVDMLIGEAFMLVTYAQTWQLRQKNSPPFPRQFQWVRVNSYDSYCSWVVGQLRRIIALFPEEQWLHDLVKTIEGQIPASHILGHGDLCKKTYQPAYFPCRCHFHGESVEAIWPHLNAYGPSLRQMNGGARHDNLNFAVNFWNDRKTLRIHDQLSDEREEALRVLSENLAHFKQLTLEAGDRVRDWSRQSRKFETRGGVVHSVYHHNFKTAATIDDVLESLKTSKTLATVSSERTAPEWLRWAIDLERNQFTIQAYVKSYREHPLQDTMNTLETLRESLNDDLVELRLHQASILQVPEILLSSHDTNLPEETIIQTPSRLLRDKSPPTLEHSLVQLEVQLRCGQANTQILAVQDKSIALSIVKSSRAFDYRGQGGITRAQRRKEMAQMLRDLEITVYNAARDALVVLGHLKADAKHPFPPMKISDTIRKDTHLFRMRGDSRIVDATAWRLLASGAPSLAEDISGHAIAPSHVSPAKRRKTNPGTAAKPDKVAKEGWIWKDDALSVPSETNENVAEFKKESERVQWFRAEAEVFRWLEQYERKHAELWRVIQRFRRDAAVWTKRADQMQRNKSLGAAAYARMHAAMWARVATKAELTFKDGNGAHKSWVQAASFDDLVARIDATRDRLFEWMQELVSSLIFEIVCDSEIITGS